MADFLNPPAPSTRGRIKVEGRKVEAGFGTRPLEKVYLDKPSEHPEIQEKVAHLLRLGYSWCGTAQEKNNKEYYEIDDPAAVQQRLGQNNGAVVTTMYFIRAAKTTKKAK